ncbi:type IV pili methyl-accepting chemotaxis transducer N-terminal domain-containing protein, partial [Xylella fastidiosa]
NRLKTAGVPAAHAEAEAEALAEVLETNLQDLAESESKNGKALARLEADMKEGFAQVDQRFVQMEKNIDQRFAQVDTRFAEIKGEMLLLKWMLG